MLELLENTFVSFLEGKKKPTWNNVEEVNKMSLRIMQQFVGYLLNSHLHI